MEKITDKVHVETEFPGCNTGFVITSEGVVLIDTPQIPSDAIKWRNEIDKYGPVRYVINTEPHGDHFSGNYFFEGVVIGHEGVRSTILNTSLEQMKERVKGMAPDDLIHLEGFRFRPPAITFSQQLSFYIGDHSFKLINFPGHTPYQTAVYIPEERIVFTSDNVIGEGNAFFPPEALPFKWLDSLKKMQDLDADVFVPGHGSICKKNYLPEMLSQIQDRIDTVKGAINQGMSLEEVQDNISFKSNYPIPPETADMAKQFQRMSIARLYEVLKDS